MQRAKRQAGEIVALLLWGGWIGVRRAEVTASWVCYPGFADWGDTFPEIEGVKKEPRMEDAGEKATCL